MADQATVPRFVHLRVHSAYSLLEGALRIEKLAKLAKADGMVALGLTDTNNLFAALEFSEKMAGAGIQPILGCSLAVDFGDAGDGEGRPHRHHVGHGRLALLAKDAGGYANLMALTSAAFLETPETEKPHVRIDRLLERSGGLVCLTGGPEGPIDPLLVAGQLPAAGNRMEALQGAFGDRLYVELQRHGLEAEAHAEPELIRLAYARSLPLVATNEPFFASPDDYEAHDALICVAEGRYVGEDDRRRLSPEHGFKTQEQMAELFADLPEAIESTLEIARRCAYRARTRKPILPQFVATAAGAAKEDQLKAEGDELTRQAEEGLRARLKAAGPAPDVTEETYWERLRFELSVIVRMQYQGYFLIVSDFIKWAKAQGIPVGPGRGSGAGSVVAWALTITDLDPMRFGLLFERFLNPERVSMPDFDIDFCQERRDEVITYVQQKYGADRVAQIITFGRLQARAVLRDVGRVLQMPYGQVDKLCKLVPNNPAKPVTLAEALESEPKLAEARDAEPAVAQLLDIAQKLEGLNRNASTHAAGVVIGDRPLVELVPLYRDPRSSLPATQFNMKWVEQAGLVKFDFLGLKTLTVLRRAEELVRRRGVELDLAHLPLDDARSYELLSSGDTLGVFQLEGSGMRDSLKRLKPNRFEDIIAMVALYRPGPMDNIPTYINRKHGVEQVADLHPLLTPILKETYGVIIYQEQVMQIAQVLSGYSLGEADLLRRAMGKKIKEEMAQQKTRFVEGAVRNGVDEAQAAFIFELVDKFAGYGFNKSHAAAYALVAYQTAYMKANHPVEFLAASMTFDMSSTDKLALLCEESRRLGIRVLPPSVTASDAQFLPENGGIRYALAALRNVGEGAVVAIAKERERSGGFASLADFAERLDPKAVNKRVLETFAAAGALEPLIHDRAEAFANADTLLAHAQRTAEDRAVGQNDLFGGGGKGSAGARSGLLQLKAVKPWPAMEALAREQEALGFYLSGHPLDQYTGVLRAQGVQRWSDFSAGLEGAVSRQGVLAGIVVAKREMASKQGNRFAFASFSDRTGIFEAVVFSDVLADAGDILEPGNAVLVHMEAARRGEDLRLRAMLIQSLDKVAGASQKGMTILLDGAALDRDPRAIHELRGKLQEGGRGEVRLLLALATKGREVELRLPGRYQVSPAIAAELQGLACVRSIEPLWDADAGRAAAA